MQFKITESLDGIISTKIFNDVASAKQHLLNASRAQTLIEWEVIA